MYPNQAGRPVLDKENDIVTDENAGRTGAVGPGGLHANLVKQTSLMGSRTPSKQQQQQQQGLKMNPPGAKTPMQQGKVSTLGLNSPSAQNVLRTKTNYQLPPTAPVADNNTSNTNLKKKSGLARTFSTTFETNNSNNNTTTTTVPSTPVKASDSRRLSLTKRGSAKARLVVHKDHPSPITEGPIKTKQSNAQNVKIDGGAAGGSTATSQRPIARLKGAPLESATTLLSIERALESEDRVVVGHAQAETKRRALTNEEDKLEIEYCPPPVEEQPYDPGFEINYEVLKTAPPPLAYHIRNMDDSDLPLADFEITPTRRPSRSLSPSPEPSPKPSSEPSDEPRIPVAKTNLTADGHLDVTWSDDDENDGSPHPKGSISSGRQFGIKDLEDEDKIRPPFDGFMFDLDGASSEDSLSEDEDDIFGGLGGGNSMKGKNNKGAMATVADEQVNEFNKAFGLDDLEDESKVQAPFSDFAFEL
ncbi:hypothetical protein BGX29_008911 [Mortierella sp. GBA35]|nr:hypothetical protein BGX29_008911 [Mortierella sp. GBA35]